MKIHPPLLLLMILMGVSTSTLAQSDTLSVEKQKSPLALKGYVAGVYENAPVSSEHSNSFGLQAALIWKNHFQIGFYNMINNNNEYREQLIFPNSFQMNYKHGGFVLGYRTNLDRAFEFNIESKIGFGEVKWTQVETGDAFLVDKFKLLQFQISVDYMLAKFLALNAYLGHRWMSDLEITGLNNDDFNGFYFGLAMKLGKFR